MVKNLVKADYQGNPDPNGNWWRFEIYCDECGEYLGGAWTVSKPDEVETDLCEACGDCLIMSMEQELMRESKYGTQTEDDT